LHVLAQYCASFTFLPRKVSCTRSALGQCLRNGNICSTAVLHSELLLCLLQTGLCIDIGQNVWGSAFNFNHEQVHSISDMKGGYLAKQKLFGYWASMLLKKYKNKLPKQHQCADGRRKFWVQLQCRDRLPFCAKFLKHCPNADRVRLTLPGKEVKLAQYCAKTCKKCQDPNTVGKHKWALLTNGDVGCDAKNGCTHQDATLARLATVNF